VIKIYGLENKVSSIHKEMMEELKQNSTPQTAGIVRKMIRYTARIAAIVILVLGSVEVYQYLTVSPEKLFSENYAAFNLHESRGQSNTAIEDAFKNANMSSVIEQFNTTKTPEAKDYFFAGNAFLSQHQPAKAADAFLNLQQKNKTDNTHFFEEDVDYYLALSYLGNNEPAKAIPLFEKIHEDKNNPYHEKISSWFLFKVKHLVP
jgi:tetratricopeptide (TPR) repeat protein